MTLEERVAELERRVTQLEKEREQTARLHRGDRVYVPGAGEAGEVVNIVRPRGGGGRCFIVRLDSGRNFAGAGGVPWVARDQLLKIENPTEGL